MLADGVAVVKMIGLLIQMEESHWGTFLELVIILFNKFEESVDVLLKISQQWQFIIYCFFFLLADHSTQLVLVVLLVDLVKRDDVPQNLLNCQQTQLRSLNILGFQKVKKVRQFVQTRLRVRNNFLRLLLYKNRRLNRIIRKNVFFFNLRLFDHNIDLNKINQSLYFYIQN